MQEENTLEQSVKPGSSDGEVRRIQRRTDRVFRLFVVAALVCLALVCLAMLVKARG